MTSQLELLQFCEIRERQVQVESQANRVAPSTDIAKHLLIISAQSCRDP